MRALSLLFSSVPEENWDELADYLKTTSIQLDEYYDQVEKHKTRVEEEQQKASTSRAAEAAEASLRSASFKLCYRKTCAVALEQFFFNLWIFQLTVYFNRKRCSPSRKYL